MLPTSVIKQFICCFPPIDGIIILMALTIEEIKKHILEAIPDDQAILKSKLVTLPRGTSAMPVVTANTAKITLALGSK